MAQQKSLRGDPTKTFFINMLVKDITLDDAILDLVDNCIDGARRQLKGKDQDLSPFSVEIKFSQKSFEISDNCGGIPLDIARTYAFRFGRDDDDRRPEASIGLFGVGMKRALFKLGVGFEVLSKTMKDGFKTAVNVSEWQGDNADWSFPYTDVPPASSVTKAGTTVTVRPLHPAIAARLTEARYEDNLIRDVGRLHRESIAAGLAIRINDRVVESQGAEILVGAGLKPKHEAWVEQAEATKVRVRLYAGVKRDEGAGDRDAGWYVYLNGRLVLGPDTTDRTGWGIGSVPRYHPQYADFRGHVFLDSEKSWVLPWNTTKSGVDLDSDLYRRVRERMMATTRELISLFNARKAEAQLTKRPLREALAKAKAVPLSSVPTSKQIKYPIAGDQPRVRNILYQKPEALADRARDELGVTTYTEVGAKTFDYWFENEIGS